MKKFLITLLILSIGIIISCHSKAKESNNEEPIHGNIKLNPTCVLTINSNDAPLGISPVLFNEVKRDSCGHFYFFDYRNCKIHKYNEHGTYVKSFLSQGEGPGQIECLLLNLGLKQKGL